MEASVPRKLYEIASLQDAVLVDVKTLLGNIAQRFDAVGRDWICAWMHMHVFAWEVKWDL